MPQKTRPWKVSLHGGHSGAYCDHATGSLREVLEAAVDYGYTIFGVSEHAPRLREDLLYKEERSLGWSVATLVEMFETYARDSAALVQEFEGRLEVLRGFEAEAVPADRYAEIMLDLRETHGFDYMVGSVHYVRDISIDGPPEGFESAAHATGGLETLAIEYYDTLERMVRELRPEVVGHLDLIRKNAPSNEAVETERIRKAACKALDTIAEFDAILDLNTAGIRKDLGGPYPRPWLVQAARERGIPFCFGDDSHGPAQVGQDVEAARDYLLALGVESITALTRRAGSIARTAIPLREE